MKYAIWFAPEAFEELAEIDARELSRIVKRIHHLARNLDDLPHEALQGKFRGWFKLRIGDFRVAYDFAKAERQLRVHMIGHRGVVYDDRSEN